MIEALPKSASGSKRNCEWSYTYVKATRMWHWRVVIQAKPVVVEGDTATELEAMREVKKHMELGV